jgi:hypothetical protein
MMKDMDDLPKINIDNTKSDPRSSTSTSRTSSWPKIRKILLIVFVVLLVLAGLSFFTIVLPAQKTYVAAKKTYAQARITWAAVKKQDVEQASVEIEKTKKELAATQKEFDAISFLRFIPIVNGYYGDAGHLLKAGKEGLTAGTVLLESIMPYADVLGLKGQGSFVMGSAEQRIQLAVRTMGKITPRIDDVSASLVKAREEVDAVNPNRYPGFLFGKNTKSQIEQAQLVTDQAVTFVEEARPLIKVLPSLLGETDEKKYLVIFQNDKELRPTGGFMTAYAVFRIDKGIIHVEKSEDIYTLDSQVRKKDKAPAPILKYLPKVSTFNLRDSNLSPDYVESMKTFLSIYESATSKVKVDGVIALDTSVLVTTIKILDDEVYAGGLRFTSEIDKRCDCPQVIYQLEDAITRPVGYLKTGRKDLLGTLLYAVMEKALKSSPKKYWGPLFQEFVTQANQKHVLFYVFNKDAQAGIEALNAAGRIKEFEGDYLHINEANFGGAKSNLFVKEKVEQEIKKGGDGTITKTITISYRNPHKPSNCDLEAGQLCLNALLRDWIRVYVPKGSKLVTSRGSEVKVTTTEDLGKTVFEGFVTVKPLGAATYTLTYTLPFKAKDNVLPLLIQKQPGTHDNEYTIKANGKQVAKFPLLTDKQIDIQL